MEIKERHGFTEINVKNAEEFIELIRPDRKNIKPYLESVNNKLIFRGQANSDWELVPSLFRNVSRTEILSNSYDGICFMHWAHLRSLVEGCDLNSSIIPFDSFDFRAEWLDEFDSRVVKDSKIWPDPKLYELIAYAQHYGVWTEFLDWTRNPLIACYFAASQVIKMKQIDGALSVWVLDSEKKNLLSNYNENLFEIIEVPKSVNRNISSQQGCFTLVRQKIARGLKLTYNEDAQKYNEIKLLNELCAEKKVNILLKISVPCKFAVTLLEYCDAYSVNAATVFRGIGGAAEYVRERLEMRYYLELLETK